MTVDKNKIDELFKDHEKSDSVAILLHRCPDPDALGAAAGFSLLLEKVFEISTIKIFHQGIISHPQNKSMKNILHINLLEPTEESLDAFNSIVVLDSDLSNAGFPELDATLRIDHHSNNREENITYLDVRSGVGSTCAIVWEYLNEYGISLEEHEEVATALVLGIKTDTLDFTSSNTSELDLEAYRKLLPHIDKQALARLVKFTLPRVIFELEAKAFENKIVNGTVLCSFVGEIKEHNRDIIPSIADRFSRMDAIGTVVILGIIGTDLVASVRSVDPKVEVVSLCHKVFGEPYSGGKEGSGAAKVPLGEAYKLIGDEEIKKIVMKEIVQGFNQKILDQLGQE